MDPIADMLTKIKNAQSVLLPTVEVQFSNFKYEIAKVLLSRGFVEKVEKKKKKTSKKEKPKEIIEITLKYENKAPAVSGVKKVSRPGQRIYLPISKIKKVKGGQGIAIISTSKGLITDYEARKQKIGGEIIAEIW